MAKKKRSNRRARKQVSGGPLEFRGGAVEAMQYKGREVILAGAAGTGKTAALLTKIHMCCELVPGIRCLIVRKTRASLTESALVTWEQFVLPEGHYCLSKGGGRMLRKNYVYRNGSEVVVGGMDDPSKILSTEYDLCYCQEATELTEEDWETLITRHRNNALSFQQIMGDCNPDAPTHWIKKRAEKGTLKLISSRHEDNPAFYDESKGGWTEKGAAYLKALSDSLTGTRRERFLEGKWVGAEGVVFPEYDERVHVVSAEGMPGWHEGYPPPDWDRYWAIDFGFKKPFSCLMVAVDHDGRMYVYKEIYQTETLVEDHAERMRKLWEAEAQAWGLRRGLPDDVLMKRLTPKALICDHDAEDRATLERHLLLMTIGARKDRKKGIQLVSERLRAAGDGRPRLFFVRGMTDRVDRLLVERKQPTGLLEEFGSYVFDAGKDEPVKEYDHSCFPAGTQVETARGPVPIEEVRVGDMALTRAGYRPVTDAAMTGENECLGLATFSDGRSVRCTPCHPFWSVADGRFVPIHRLPVGAEVLRIDGAVSRLVSFEEAPWDDVYNITVAGEHEYYAGGVLVSNCDALRYLTAYLDFGMGGSWEAAQGVPRAGVERAERAGNPAVEPRPSLRWGEGGMRTEEGRTGRRLFGREGM